MLHTLDIIVCISRDGTQDDPDDADGSGWSVLDGKFIQVAVGSGAVWGLGANREFFYRCGYINLKTLIVKRNCKLMNFLLQSWDREEHW